MRTHWQNNIAIKSRNFSIYWSILQKYAHKTAILLINKEFLKCFGWVLLHRFQPHSLTSGIEEFYRTNVCIVCTNYRNQKKTNDTEGKENNFSLNWNIVF